MTFPDGCGPDQIVDDGGDATILLIEGLAAEKKYKENGELPDETKANSDDARELLKIIKESL